MEIKKNLFPDQKYILWNVGKEGFIEAVKYLANRMDGKKCVYSMKEEDSNFILAVVSLTVLSRPLYCDIFAADCNLFDSV